MTPWIFLAFQSAAAAGLPAPQQPSSDAAALSVARRCEGASGDILVCARPQDQRLPKLDPRFEKPMLDGAGHLVLRLTDNLTLGGGGPKGSTGFGLKLRF